MPRGGAGRGQGRKPGKTKAKLVEQALTALEKITVDNNSVAGEILLAINYRDQYLKIFRTRGNYATKARLLTHLLDKCTGRPFTAADPTAAKRHSDDPKLQAVLRDLLPPPGNAQVTITEKIVRIGPKEPPSAPAPVIDSEFETQQPGAGDEMAATLARLEQRRKQQAAPAQ